MACGCQTSCGCDVTAGAGIVVQRVLDTFVVSVDLEALIEDTNCIGLAVNDGLLSASIILDPDQGPAVDLTCTPDGLRADLNIDPTSTADVTITEDGLKVDVAPSDVEIDGGCGVLVSQDSGDGSWLIELELDEATSEDGAIDLSCGVDGIAVEVRIDPASPAPITVTAAGLSVAQAADQTTVAGSNCIDVVELPDNTFTVSVDADTAGSADLGIDLACGVDGLLAGLRLDPASPAPLEITEDGLSVECCIAEGGVLGSECIDAEYDDGSVTISLDVDETSPVGIACEGTGLRVGDAEVMAVGGSFTTENGALRARFVTYDVSDKDIGAIEARIGGQVNALATDGTYLFVGGSFTLIEGTVTRNNLCSFSLLTGELTSWNPNMSSDVHALAVSGSELFVGGAFTTVNGATTRNRLCSFTIGNSTVTAWDPNVGTSSVRALAVSGSELFVGGIFTTVNGGTTRNRLCSFTIGNSTVTAWDPNMSSSVYSLSIDGSDLFVGGAFTTVNGGTTRNRLCSFTIGNATVTAWDPNIGTSTVYALAVSGTELFVGGDFTTVNGGTTRNRLCSFTIGNPTVTAWDPNMSSTVYALAVSGTELFAGGDFATVNGGTTRNRLCSFTIGSSTVTAWNPNMGNTVRALLPITVPNVAQRSGNQSITGQKTFETAPQHGVQQFTASGSINPYAGKIIQFEGSASQAITMPTAELGMEFVFRNMDTTDSVLLSGGTFAHSAGSSLRVYPGEEYMITAVTLSGAVVWAASKHNALAVPSASFEAAEFIQTAPRTAVQALTATGSISLAGGRVVTFAGAASQTITMPPVDVGMEFEIYNIDTADSVTITAAGSDTFTSPMNTATLTSFTLPFGARVKMACYSGTTWRIIPLGPEPLVSVLPAAPYNGMVVRYQTSDMLATHTAEWTFRYNSAGSTNKWEFVGGPPLTVNVDTSESTSSATFANLTTAENITIPLSGSYSITHGGYPATATATATAAILSPSGAGLTATDTYGASVQFNTSSNGQSITVSRTKKHALTAGTLRLQARSSGASSIAFPNRFISVTPIAVA